MIVSFENPHGWSRNIPTHLLRLHDRAYHASSQASLLSWRYEIGRHDLGSMGAKEIDLGSLGQICCYVAKLE